MPLQEAIETYCQADLGKEIAGFHRELLCETSFDRKGFLECVRGFRNFSREMIPETARAVRSAKKLALHFDQGKSCNVRKELARLERVDWKLKEGKNDFPMIQYLLAPIELIVRYPEETGNEELDACVQSHRLYSGLKQCLESSLPLVEDLVRVLSDEGDSKEPIEFIAPQAPDDRLDETTRTL